MRSAVRVVALSAAVAVLAPATAGAAAPSFAPYTTFATGSPAGPGPAPVGAVGADFDGDGRQDVAAVGNFGFSDAVLLRGTGAAAFGAATTIPGTSGAQSLAAGDIDGDGDADLVGMTPNSAIIARNAGNGSFTISQTLPLTLGAQVQAILTDTDGDGDLDIAAPTFTAIQTLRNTGQGTFATGPSTSVPGATSLSAISSADVDGSPVRDLFAADGGTGVVYALRGSAGGAFTVSGQLYGAGFGLEDVAAVDLDGDGIDDVATVGSFSFTVGTALSNGQGGFRSPLATIGAATPGPTSLSVGDLDRDGRADLAVSVLATPNPGIRVFAGNGTVRPAEAGSFTTGAFPQNPIVRDLNADQKLDIVVAAPGNLYVLRNITP